MIIYFWNDWKFLLQMYLKLFRYLFVTFSLNQELNFLSLPEGMKGKKPTSEYLITLSV